MLSVIYGANGSQSYVFVSVSTLVFSLISGVTVAEPVAIPSSISTIVISMIGGAYSF